MEGSEDMLIKDGISLKTYVPQEVACLLVAEPFYTGVFCEEVSSFVEIFKEFYLVFESEAQRLLYKLTGMDYKF